MKTYRAIQSEYYGISNLTRDTDCIKLPQKETGLRYFRGRPCHANHETTAFWESYSKLLLIKVTPCCQVGGHVLTSKKEGGQGPPTAMGSSMMTFGGPTLRGGNWDHRIWGVV